MSTLNVSNITDGTDTVGTSYVLNGSAKALANLLTDASLQGSATLNISSTTDVATGNFQANTTNAFAASNDLLGFMSPRSTDDVCGPCAVISASQVAVRIIDISSATNEDKNVSIVMHGDLA